MVAYGSCEHRDCDRLLQTRYTTKYDQPLRLVGIDFFEGSGAGNRAECGAERCIAGTEGRSQKSDLTVK